MKRILSIIIVLAITLGTISFAFADTEPLSSPFTGIWTIDYFVDEFGDPTSDAYITNSKELKGHFSNSATTDSELEAVFLIDKKYVAIVLYEYGRYLVKNSSPHYDDIYTVAMKDGNGKKHSLKGTIYAGGDRIMFNDSDGKKIINALSSGGKVSFSIVNSNYSVSTYLFSVNDPAGFDNAYQILTGKLQ